jgi:hypothetical protein
MTASRTPGVDGLNTTSALTERAIGCYSVLYVRSGLNFCGSAIPDTKNYGLKISGFREAAHRSNPALRIE